MLTIEQRLQHLEDEAAIRDLAARFADAATRADYESIRSLFTPDAVFTIGEPFAVTCQGNADHCLRLDLPQKAERPGSVSGEISGGRITRVSHREPLDGCGDGKLGNLGR
jgi:hypothetical protein